MVVAPEQIITLHPGDVAVGVRGDCLQTLLGSCVAVVLTDPRRTVGVMCHIVHAKPATPMQIESNAYADVALQTMVKLLQSHGMVASMCQGYVFGGGNMFPEIVPGASIGDDNVLWVLNALQAMKVKVLAIDVGGAVYRQLRWVVGPDAPHAVAVPL